MGLPKRKSIRLSGYDYSQNGYYFITICTQDRNCIFGNIVNNKMVLNNTGNIIEHVWKTLPQHHPVELDMSQIMPNHMHFIIQIVGALRAMPEPETGCARTTPTEFGYVASGTLSCIIRSFKSETTKQIRRFINNPNITIWQRNYYEHIIRNDQELNKIREYIKSNPLMWDRDRNNPTNPRICLQ